MHPKEAVELLMNDGISFAKRMLSEYGEFHPYGRVLGADSKIVVVAVNDVNEYPIGAEYLQLLEDGLRDKASKDGDMAIATFANVPLRGKNAEPNEAIQVSLEHISGYSVNVYYPYSINEGDVKYGDLIAMTRAPNIF